MLLLQLSKSSYERLYAWVTSKLWYGIKSWSLDYNNCLMAYQNYMTRIDNNNQLAICLLLKMKAIGHLGHLFAFHYPNVHPILLKLISLDHFFLGYLI